MFLVSFHFVFLYKGLVPCLVSFQALVVTLCLSFINQEMFVMCR